MGRLTIVNSYTTDGEEPSASRSENPIAPERQGSGHLIIHSPQQENPSMPEQRVGSRLTIHPAQTEEPAPENPTAVPRVQVEEILHQLTEKEAELANVRTQLTEKETELIGMQSQLTDRDQTIAALEEQLRETESSEAWDLEDKDSVIADLRSQIADLNAQVEAYGQDSPIGVPQDPEEIRALCSEQERRQEEYDRMQTELNETRQKLADTRRELQTVQSLNEGSEDLENIRRRIRDLETEKGQAYEELCALNETYLCDRKYVTFFEKDPEKKFDGLELFRVKLSKLDGQLSELLNASLKKAYIFRGSSLLDDLDEYRKASFRTLTELTDLLESADWDAQTEGGGKDGRPEEVTDEDDRTAGGTDGDVCAEDDPDVYRMDASVQMASTDESKTIIREKLNAYEKLLREMYDAAEKILKIENAIAFDGNS